MKIALIGIGLWCGLVAFWVGCAVWAEHRDTRRRRERYTSPRLRLIEGGR